MDRLGIPWDRELPRAARVLSPSDLGFHNAVQRDGQLVFLDFEYFGWDDPAKLICDFVLHPAMALSEPLKRRFVCEVLAACDAEAGLARRLTFCYPLYGLKWCMIFLNEFVPQDLFRRGFATQEARAREAIQSEQLTKAHGMLDHVERTYTHFPYGGEPE